MELPSWHLGIGIHQRLKTNKQTFATKKMAPFERPSSSLKKIVDHMLPIITIVMVNDSPFA
jgi:hypothetical protein